MVLYELLVGHVPFRANSLKELKDVILRGKYNVPFYVGQMAKDLVNKMLLVEPDERIPVR